MPFLFNHNYMWIRSKPKANNQGLILEVIFMEANGFDDSFGYIWGILTLNQLHYFSTIAWNIWKRWNLIDALNGHKGHGWKSVNSDTTYLMYHWQVSSWVSFVKTSITFYFFWQNNHFLYFKCLFLFILVIVK